MKTALGIGLLCAATLAAAEIHRPRILDRVPHDPEAFVQGLLIDGDAFWVGTGKYGKSELREVDRRTGEVRRRVELDEELYGEGVALLDGRFYQLTWRENVCLVYDKDTLREVARHRYEGEGWGLATDGKRLYMSDGSDIVRVMDPERFRERRRIQVRFGGRPVRGLNELEWVDGELWANVFQTKWIVRIDPETGQVVGRIDLRLLPLPPDRHPEQDVLNGIAVDPETGHVWVTGKYWKAIYRIEWPPGSR